jgi:hypothetical protein
MLLVNSKISPPFVLERQDKVGIELPAANTRMVSADGGVCAWIRVINSGHQFRVINFLTVNTRQGTLRGLEIPQAQETAECRGEPSSPLSSTVGINLTGCLARVGSVGIER